MGTCLVGGLPRVHPPMSMLLSFIAVIIVHYEFVIILYHYVVIIVYYDDVCKGTMGKSAYCTTF